MRRQGKRGGEMNSPLQKGRRAVLKDRVYRGGRRAALKDRVYTEGTKGEGNAAAEDSRAFRRVR